MDSNDTKTRQIVQAFTHRDFTPDQLERVHHLNNEAINLGYLIMDSTRPGRLQSLALTQLEVAIGHARDAIRQENV